MTLLRIAAVLLLWAVPGVAEDTHEERVDRLLTSLGAQSFERHCAACHGSDGRGRGPVADVLTVPPADLTRIAARRGGVFPDAEIARFIDGRFEIPSHGTREMPIWGARFGERVAPDIAPDEIVRGRLDLLVMYLRTIQRADETRPKDAGDKSREER